ncbi:SDR family oxidoreductase [Amycolatopsis thermophila]|uniref:NAD(P)-dependent dehydrogenase (Short-subunit alcohol dehydrogenase family) n=1 Tax=Amycolatopsis thermophila TaxID=206084 RepID=A0ABU0F784_9PSEU|nr:SDR family oxidoreductase [Amycolatopsis thermophila]MDQ0382867.1 NAD(P)-dependent dehydrogenase (short-subunit alcohol dehydrogenase family) [Amycolatopsis thermophila]
MGTDLDASGAGETVELVRAAGGTMDSTHPLNLGDEDGVTAWIDGAAAAHGGSTTNTRIAHTASEGGVGAMTKQLAAEGAAHGIRANCVSPGTIATPASAATLLADDHPMRTIARAIPLGRIGTPEDVARCALFLASDEAVYVTGANLVVDGGWSAVLPGA